MNVPLQERGDDTETAAGELHRVWRYTLFRLVKGFPIVLIFSNKFEVIDLISWFYGFFFYLFVLRQELM